jgi:hypothetical protein
MIDHLGLQLLQNRDQQELVKLQRDLLILHLQLTAHLQHNQAAVDLRVLAAAEALVVQEVAAAVVDQVEAVDSLN